MANLVAPEYQAVRGNATWYADIDSIPPANILVLARDGRESLREYWQPCVNQNAQYSTVDEACEAFRDVFGQAVKSRQRTIKPPGLLLSGGMDSASIAATLQAQVSEGGWESFDTYSVISDNVGACIESQCIKLLAE